jgi:GTP-binding protein HflX
LTQRKKTKPRKFAETEKKENAYLVAVESRSGPNPPMPVEYSLRELARLVRTAGGTVSGSTSQRRVHPHPTLYIGRGKIDEIKARKEELKYSMIVFDDQLSPSQQLNLEKAFGVKVLDRSALILDIFAQRARTREATLQVELAQHQYLKPRLRGQWQHLSRTVGGPGAGSGSIGTRGPGETQLETDRRLIDRRISKLKRDIQGVRNHRERQRDRRLREGMPIVALVGYTNTGKSSLLKALVGSDVFVADAPFATLDPLTRRLGGNGDNAVLMTDTVGFMQKLPTELVSAFQTTLEELSNASLLIHVLDANSPVLESQERVVRETLDNLGLKGIPTLTVINKVDTLFPKNTIDEVMDINELMNGAYRGNFNRSDDSSDEYLFASATERWGIHELRTRILYEFFGPAETGEC